MELMESLMVVAKTAKSYSLSALGYSVSCFIHILFILLESALIWALILTAYQMGGGIPATQIGDGNPEIVIFPGMQHHILHPYFISVKIA